MFDLDRFKQVNDGFGHLAGDHVLREVARLIGETVRREDLFARYGGEEFAMCCRSTGVVQAAELGERIRARIAARPFAYDGRPVPVTVSVGVAQARAEDTVEALIDRADRMLYRAKREGRDRVVYAPAS
jgi:diguanylate cyclase (GGDEF)-like protein